MPKFYDATYDRIVTTGRKSDAGFWDRQWQNYDLREMIASGQRNTFIKKHTAHFLKKGAKILEGGCGLGQNVYALSAWGYEAYGVDYARETIEKVKAAVPELKVSAQDVRKLDFPDGFFDGYWSLGVIEHFYNGYDDIIREASRVIRRGGGAFYNLSLYFSFAAFENLRESLRGFSVGRRA